MNRLADQTQGFVDTAGLSDPELVAAIADRAARERCATADLIRILIEFDRRRLYLAEGYPSLFAYCTQVLHYSEHGAFNRIEVARAAARWPQLLSAIEDGSLHLAGARLLAPHLTEENVEMALASARHKSKREIEDVAARLARRNLLVAVATEQYRLHLTISRQTRDMLLQVQDLLGPQLEEGNVAIIFERALALLHAKLERDRTGATSKPRSPKPSALRSRHVPAAVKREVWERDSRRCAFVGRQGRCPETRGVELHHVIPYAAGGETTAGNLELRCHAHNAYEAESYFGADAVATARLRRKDARPRSSAPKKAEPSGEERSGPDGVSGPDRGSGPDGGRSRGNSRTRSVAASQGQTKSGKDARIKGGVSAVRAESSRGEFGK